MKRISPIISLFNSAPTFGSISEITREPPAFGFVRSETHDSELDNLICLQVDTSHGLVGLQTQSRARVQEPTDSGPSVGVLPLSLAAFDVKRFPEERTR